MFSPLIANTPIEICLPGNDNFYAYIYIGVTFGRCEPGPAAGMVCLPTQVDTVSPEDIRAYTALVARHLGLPVTGSILTDLDQFVADAAAVDAVILDDIDVLTFDNL